MAKEHIDPGTLQPRGSVVFRDRRPAGAHAPHHAAKSTLIALVWTPSVAARFSSPTARADLMIALEGTQPVFRQSPPSR